MKQLASGLSYEKAYARLEEILEKLNDRLISLDDSLALYEEANKLMKLCSDKLRDAEKKIEVIKKDSAGNPEIASSGAVQTEPLSPMN